MGCDYYTVTQLRIVFVNPIDSNHGNVVVLLNRENGYFGKINCDSDDENYEREYEKYKKKCFTPDSPPMLLYDAFNGEFINDNIRLKYGERILAELKSHNVTFDHVVSIHKEQYMYERD
jgi:hypothetical protein